MEKDREIYFDNRREVKRNNQEVLKRFAGNLSFWLYSKKKVIN